MTSYETRRKQFIEQLAIVRNDNLKAQKQFLADLQGSHSGYAHLMSPDDVNWIAPLALEPFLPAVDVLLDCMQKKMCFYDETFFDEDLKENVVIERADCYFEETTFASNEELKKEIGEHIMSLFPKLSDVELKEYFDTFLPWEYREKIQAELLKRNDKDALLHLAMDYRAGDEASGIFIDFDKARQIYDQLGVKKGDFDDEDFDPVKEAADLRKNAIESFPEFATFVVEGSSAPAVKHLIEELNDMFGEKGEMYFNIPLEVLMEILVGSKYYVGYIQTLTEHSPKKIEFTAEFYSCSPDCLMHALLQSFEDINVTFTHTK